MKSADAHVVEGVIEGAGPGKRWSVDFTGNGKKWNKDYAIVAHFQSAYTDMPVIVVAGIGKAGTLAATEFVTDPKYIPLLRQAGVNGQHQNFEAVLSTAVIDGEPGPPRLEAIRTW